jgi:hypothetical protein
LPKQRTDDDHAAVPIVIVVAVVLLDLLLLRRRPHDDVLLRLPPDDVFVVRCGSANANVSFVALLAPLRAVVVGTTTAARILPLLFLLERRWHLPYGMTILRGSAIASSG